MRRLVSIQFVQKLVIAGVVGVGGYAVASAAVGAESSPATKPASTIRSNSSADVHTESTGQPEPAEEAAPQTGSHDSSSNTSHTEVTVNGQSVNVPTNGSLNQTINTNNGTANVSITNQTSSTSETSNSHRTQVTIRSSSNSDSSVITRDKETYRSR